MPRISILIKEKIDSKRYLIDEKAKVEQNLKKLKENVDKIKADYNGEVDKLKQHKSKYFDTSKFKV